MARPLSVNVGLPRDVSWQGEKVFTSVWKEPVQGSRKVRRLNVLSRPPKETCWSAVRGREVTSRSTF